MNESAQNASLRWRALREAWPLVIILIIAAALRFTGLTHGLRHTPLIDERFFVEGSARMLSQGTLDPGFYEYPGLLMYILCLPLVFLAPEQRVGFEGYLAARLIVATLSLFNVWLACRLGTRLAGRLAGLFTAALLAVSPVSVQTAHLFRPDVILSTASLLAILAMTGEEDRRSDAIRAGILLGIANAVKFTAVLLVPSYLLRRVQMGWSWRRAMFVLLMAGLTFMVLSPYTLLGLDRSIEGMRSQVMHHWSEEKEEALPYWRMLALYAAVWPKALGVFATALALAGLLSRRFVRVAWPWLIYPLLNLFVIATAQFKHDRLLVPSMGVLAIVCGAGWARVSERSKIVGYTLALAALMFPASESMRYVRDILEPSARDRVVAYLNEHLPQGSSVLTSQDELGIDRERFEVLTVKTLKRSDLWWARHMDAVVTGSFDDEAILYGLTTVFSAQDRGVDFILHVQRPAWPGQPQYQPIPVLASWVQASHNSEQIASLFDNDLGTFWQTPAPQQPGYSLLITFPRVLRVGRIELLLGERVKEFAANLHVFVPDSDGSAWKRVFVYMGRPRIDGQAAHDRGKSQDLIIDPIDTRAIRIEQVGQRLKPWSVAELKLWSPVADETSSR